MQHTKYLQTRLLHDNRNLIELELKDMLKYGTTTKMISDRLHYIFNEYGCSYLGYQLIRFLHSKSTSEGDFHLIFGQSFAAQNLSSPSQASVEDKKRYAQLLADLVKETAYTPIDHTYAIALFETILIENCFLEKDGQLRPITKWDAYDTAHMLSMSLPEAEMLVSKTFTDGSLSVLNAHNLIEKFSFLADLSKEKRNALLVAYKEEEKSKRRVTGTDRKAGVTTKVGNVFSDLFKDVDALKTETGFAQFYKKLIKEAPRLKGASNTARIIFEQILSFAVKLAEPDYYAAETKEVTVFSDLKKHVDQALDSFSKTDGDYYPLSEEARRALMRNLFAENSADNLKEAYFSWSVPIWTGEAIKKDSLASRTEAVLTGKKPVRKEDILVALFIVCSRFWENIVSSSKAEKEIHAVRTNRLKNYINAANMYLKQAYLQKYYLPHPTESVITYAILAGDHAGICYADSIAQLEENAAIIHYSTTNPARFGIPKSNRENRVTVSDFDQAQQDLFERLEGKIRRFLYRCIYSNPNDNLLTQIKIIAKNIHQVYVAERFAGIDVYFTEREKDGAASFEYGFIPTVNIGRSYVQIGNILDDFYQILIGKQKIDLLFRETRIPETWRKELNKEDLYAPWTIDTRYPEIKKLPKELQQLLYTKALLVLLQREIITLLRLSPRQEPVERRDRIDDHETDIINSNVPETEEEMEEDEARQETAFPFPVEISVGKHVIVKIPALDNVTFSADKCREI